MSLLTPVKYPVKYYKWDDDQAPQLTDADGVIKTILKACLVTGYGDKAGAGWTARFEDDSRIVLRRPLQIGNPPDIKLENGVVNGQTSHRIVLQNNPSGLDDTNELGVIGIITRDASQKQKWWLVATDFAFILIYKMFYQNSNDGNTNTIFFIGGASGLLQDNNEIFLATHHNADTKTGRDKWTYPFITRGEGFKYSALITANRVQKFQGGSVHRLSATIDANPIAQALILYDIKAKMPFYLGLFEETVSNESTNGKEVQILGRPMLIIKTKDYSSGTKSLPYIIPLDYWEL